ncbi:hypothetical protein CONLIGDRAFT_107882 [Coniochaeta ligniaria NRRL 30616]|uniref:Uncharacterized protein n=1 Tax=Coniochaeta ligniaria NRRL 30616 TaxID=1408157 RepID=A0A1J7J330_9PEZI|nr:hypothetical protein CONLIGDRAFT_107882 [Coniochaeta ligniaria NRRL 30616]
MTDPSHKCHPFTLKTDSLSGRLPLAYCVSCACGARRVSPMLSVAVLKKRRDGDRLGQSHRCAFYCLWALSCGLAVDADRLIIPIVGLAYSYGLVSVLQCFTRAFRAHFL